MSATDAIEEYSLAKSRADLEAAISQCTDDIMIETYPFQISSIGRAETLEQWQAFFALFPDYQVQLERLIEDGTAAAGWGTISATMSTDIGAVACTGRRFSVPFTCVWETRDGLIARERFYFDLNHVCEQLHIPTADVAEVLHAISDGYAMRRQGAA